MSPIYRNTNTDQVVHYDKPDARLEGLDNWEELNEAQAAKLDKDKIERPIQFSAIGEVSEDGAIHGAGTKQTDDSLNADKKAAPENAKPAGDPGDAGNPGGDGSEGQGSGDDRPNTRSKVEDIDAYADKNKIDLGGAKTKDEKLALIDAWHEK